MSKDTLKKYKYKNVYLLNWPFHELVLIFEVSKINIRADGIKQIFFQDPDGYWIEVNSVGKN